MSNENATNIACRKCNAVNPVSNEYCVECGAVLKVSTALMRAQPGRVLPHLHQFRVKWLLAGCLVMLGCAVVSVAVVGLMTMVMLGKSQALSLQAMGSSFGMLTLVVTLLVFAFGGLILSLLSRDTRVAESVIASFLAAVLVGLAGQSLSDDFFILALLLAIPCALGAGVGAWLGGRNNRRGR